MPRIYLTLIILSVLIAIFFSESDFFFVEKNLVFLEKEIILSEPIILTGLSVTILSILLMLNLAEKTYDLFVRNKKSKSLMNDGQRFIYVYLPTKINYKDWDKEPPNKFKYNTCLCLMGPYPLKFIFS